MFQKEYIGKGKIKNLKNILEDHSPNSIFLVTGKKSYISSGAKDTLYPILKKYNRTEFSNFSTNPKLEEITQGIEKFKKNDCDIIIAIGGGSTLDTAKLINILSSQEKEPSEYIFKKSKIKFNGKPLIAIPTTTGSGSEATHFAVIYIDKRKYSLAHEFILPNYSILDSNFSTNLTSKLIAVTGMDALSHAIESYWNINSTKKSKEFASKSINLIMNNLENAVNNTSEQSLEKMLIASNLAGKAINITKTTACHSISYPITSYFNIPHGHATALTLGEILVFNSQTSKKNIQDSRGIYYINSNISEINKLLETNSAEESKNKIKKLMKNIGLETKLKKLNITNIKKIINEFDQERVKNNPRKINKKELNQILKNIYE